MSSSLQQLLQRPDIWRSRESRLPTSDGRGYTTGFTGLDRELHGNGWPRGALTELLIAQAGVGELYLLTPFLADISRQQLLQMWINPPFIPYAPAFVQRDIALDSLLIVRGEPQHHVWACEQALRSAACGAVLYWPAKPLRYAELRKLQVAAASQHAVGFIFSDIKAAQRASPAVLRLQLDAIDSQLSIRIIKQRSRNHGYAVILPREQALQPTPFPFIKIFHPIESIVTTSSPTTISAATAASPYLSAIARR
jgi:cell division inhibitor SulA